MVFIEKQVSLNQIDCVCCYTHKYRIHLRLVQTQMSSSYACGIFWVNTQISKEVELEFELEFGLVFHLTVGLEYVLVSGLVAEQRVVVDLDMHINHSPCCLVGNRLDKT